ncbi:MAG: Asp23/Gls24 family envelope stress response protein [Gaiellaceae bacterium]
MTEPLVFRNAAGSVTVTAAALSRLVADAVGTVDGARLRRPRRGLEIRHADGHATVTLELSGRFGEPLPELARTVQERVAEALAQTAGLEVERVDVEIEEVA